MPPCPLILQRVYGDDVTSLGDFAEQYYPGFRGDCPGMDGETGIDIGFD